MSSAGEPRRVGRSQEEAYKKVGPSERESYQAAVLSLLLQEHRSTQTSRLVLDTVGRLVSAGLVLFVSRTSALSAAQVVAGTLVAVLVATVWWRGRWRMTWRTRGLEETLSRMTGGPAEHAYIESRFFLDSRPSALDGVLRAEPGVWFAVSMIVLTINAVVGGVAS
jgi:hypothetical protein